MKHLFIILISFVNLSSLFSQTTSEERIKLVENGLTPNVRFAKDPTWEIESRMKHYQVPGVSIAVFKDYQIDWAKAYGLANAETGEKATTETAFQAASISKTINALGVLKWANENDVDIYSDINTLLKSWQFEYEGNPTISIHQLLTHTAGLSVHGFLGYKDDENLPTTVQILKGEKPANNRPVRSLFASDEKFKYSGGGTTITQLILEDHVGDYASYMDQTLFTPLNMDRSFYPTNFKGQVSMSHNRKGEIRKNGYNIYPELGAAALWTTPTDLAKLLIEMQRALADQSTAVVSKEIVNGMATPWKEGNFNGMGTFLDNSGDISYFQHSGGNEGFNCLYYASMEEGHGAIVMINAEKFELINEIMRSISTVYNWHAMKPQVIEQDGLPSTSDMKSYVGEYRFTEDEKRVLSISFKKEKLFIESKKQWKSELIPKGNRVFVTKDINPPATIIFDQNKMIVEQEEKYEWIRED